MLTMRSSVNWLVRPTWLAGLGRLDGCARFSRCRSTLTERLGVRVGSVAARRAQSSYSAGPTYPPLLTQTIPEYFSTIVSAHGDRPAVICPSQSQRLTYALLDAQSNSLARGLQSIGVTKGSRVAVSLGNTIEHAIITYAVFKLGAILVPLNPAFTSSQVISALAHLDASHLIIGAETCLPYKAPRPNISLLAEIFGNDLSTPAPNSGIHPSKLPHLKQIILVDNSAGRVPTCSLKVTIPFEELWRGNDGGTFVPREELDKDDIVNIQFTSGTTSMPKAACLSHENILNNGYFIGQRMGLTREDVVVCPPPLFHCFGCVLGYLATVTHGSAIVFPSEAFNPHATLLAVQQERATALYGVSTMFVAELELLANNTIPYQGFEHLRTGIAAGSSVPSTLMKKLHDMLNLKGLTICYGMTETSPVSLMTTPTDPLAKRLSSVGKAMPHVSVKIVRVDDRSKIVPLGQRGELAVAGYLVMKGYWGDKAKTREVRVREDDGKVWMYTGDEAEMDREGYVSIEGRLKDLIIRGGENIHPLEIENCLFGHEMVVEVSVVGVPDERYGEAVAAFVVPHRGVRVEGGIGGDGKGDVAGEGHGVDEGNGELLTKEEIRGWVRERLSSHLVPKHVFWVMNYPKTASGKIQKFKLREMAIEVLKKAES